MSHEVETMAYAGEVPWHGLGLKVDHNLTPAEMLKAAGLDWRVELKQLKFSDGVQDHEVPGRFALVRDKDNRVMTVTGRNWKPVQNEDLLGLMKSYVEAGACTLETAGSLRDGKRIWSLANLNHEFQVRPGDRVKGYLMLAGSHEVGVATVVRTTAIRVVCANTWRMAESEGSVIYRQNHMAELDVASAKDAIGEANETLAAAERRCKTLSELKLGLFDGIKKAILPAIIGPFEDDELIEKMITMPSIAPKILNEVVDSYMTAPGSDQETGWGAFNAITHWATHKAGRDMNRRIERQWFGDTQQIVADVERRLLELA